MVLEVILVVLGVVLVVLGVVLRQCSEQMFGTDSVRNNVPSQHKLQSVRFSTPEELQTPSLEDQKQSSWSRFWDGLGGGFGWFWVGFEVVLWFLLGPPEKSNYLIFVT